MSFGQIDLRSKHVAQDGLDTCELEEIEELWAAEVRGEIHVRTLGLLLTNDGAEKGQVLDSRSAEFSLVGAELGYDLITIHEDIMTGQVGR